MFLLNLLLFWVPIVGPFIAGYVGGKAAGSLRNALLAVFLPSIVLGICIFFYISVFTGFPFLGMMIASGGVALVVSMDVGPLLLGAIIGGLIG